MGESFVAILMQGKHKKPSYVWVAVETKTRIICRVKILRICQTETTVLAFCVINCKPAVGSVARPCENPWRQQTGLL